MLYKNLSYALAAVAFSMVLGAGIYEHLSVWPAAFAAPPQSLTIFQGAYKLTAENFWMMIHPVALFFFAVTLALNWNTARRKFILAPLLIYVLILIITFSYFVPELKAITGTPYSYEVNPGLQRRGSQWISLSLVRAALLLVIMVSFNYGLSRPATRRVAI